jgi:diacylglycerol kinase family enzyme
MPIDPATICVLANPASGRNSRDAAALDQAMAAFGPTATLRRWDRDTPLSDAVALALRDGFTTLVAAGGDGTVNGVAQALLGSEANLGVLPLGTFNFFARGLGLPEAPDAAARAILSGTPRRISVGTVNGQIFLNNASLGVYPRILKLREEVYARFGRSRLIAHWTVLTTLIGVQTARRMVIHADGQSHDLRTSLVFVARSAYQLDRFGLTGAAAISDDRFAVFIAREGNRWHLLKLAFHLALRRLQPGVDVDVLSTRQMTVSTASPRPRVAFDGEKRRMRAPLEFRIHDNALSIILPRPEDRVTT